MSCLVVWQRSGHVDNFCDPLSECKSCHRRHRLDHVVEHFIEAESIAAADAPVLGDSNALFEFVQHHGVKCPACGAHGDTGLAPPKNFNMLFQTSVGPTQHPYVLVLATLSATVRQTHPRRSSPAPS